ncbi:MAG: homocysteine S-methyltransferase [Candidatus Flexifilum sp.]|jgi:homocysteine S-methyltransferase
MTALRNPIADILAVQPVVVLDGALATELERRGCDLRDPLWSARVLIEQPDLIRQVHYDYFAAGSDCATTASYQATFPGFAARGLDHDAAARLMRLSVELAREARDAFWGDPARPAARPYPFVAASIGPYGAYLHDGSEYRGDYHLSVQDLIDFHRPRMAELIAAGADMLAFETIPCWSEAEALVRLLAEFPGVTAWMSFSARDGAHISHGEPFAECAARLDDVAQIAAVGINCTAPEFIPDLIRAGAAVTRKPILAYPNSGETWDAAGQTWRGETSCALYGDQARAWYEAGARVIGGCCRTTPEHIREVAALRAHRV